MSSILLQLDQTYSCVAIAKSGPFVGYLLICGDVDLVTLVVKFLVPQMGQLASHQRWQRIQEIASGIPLVDVSDVVDGLVDQYQEWHVFPCVHF